MPSRIRSAHTSARLAGGASLAEVSKAAAKCKNCDLWRNATQTVFGEGNQSAEIVLIGEQPGNQEDLQGLPFVGPAGKVLDKALERAGIERSSVYVTNSVKHFKWVRKGKLRIHMKPRPDEVDACRPWLDKEISIIRPKVIVCMGATAAQSLLGSKFRLTQHHGEFLDASLPAPVTATVHPSAILRAPTTEARHAMMEEFLSDLATVSNKVSELGN